MVEVVGTERLSNRLARDIGDIIADYCHSCGKPYTNSRMVAKEMGVSPSTLSRWLAGKNQPSAHLLDAADAYIKAWNAITTKDG